MKQTNGQSASKAKRKFGKLLISFLRSIWRRKIRLILVGIVLLGVLFVISAGKYNDTAEGEITLSYSNAFKGLNPNGTRFNIYEIVSDELLDEVLTRTRLDAFMSKRDFYECLSISPSVVADIEKRYITNVYDIKLTLPKDLPYKVDAKNVLNLLLEAYNRDFDEKYVLNRAVLNLDWSMVYDLEYTEFASLISMRVDTLMKFVDEMADASLAAAYKMEGESFNSLRNSLENFKALYLDKYAAYINVQNVFRDAETYAEKLSYRSLLLGRDYSNAEKLHQVYKDVLSSYDESVIAFMMVPMYDTKDGLYMARTSTGMDALAINSSGYSETSRALSEEITLCNEEMAAAKSASINKAAAATADEMIYGIIRELNLLVQRISRSVDEYETYAAESNISCVVKYPRKIFAYELKQNLIITAAALFALSVLFTVRDRRKELDEK